jgi:hypothetical protein
MPEAVAIARVVVAAVVVGDVVGLCGSFAAAADHIQTSVYWRKTSAACCNSNSSEFLTLRSQARKLTERTASTASVYYFSEVVVLIIIVGSFSYVGCVSARVVRDRVQLIHASSAAAAVGKELHLSIMATTAFVFATFLLRLIYSAMFAFAFAFQDSANDIMSCSSAPSSPSVQGFCSPCFNTCVRPCVPAIQKRNIQRRFTHMLQWMDFTPQFQVIVVLVSSPLSLMVALWGMTSKKTLKMMRECGSDKNGAESAGLASAAVSGGSLL